MATSLAAAVKFTAVDKFTGVVQKMTAATTSFSQKASAGFAMVQRAETKMRQGISNTLGKLGQLGLAFGGASLAMMAFGANVELDKRLQSLQAITDVTGTKFDAFRIEIDRVSKSQKMFAGDTAKAFEIVGSAKSELLSDAKALAQVTEAAMVFSKSGAGDMETSTNALVGVLNQFNLTADQSTRAINALAAGSIVGAANAQEVNESINAFGTGAKMMNVSLEQSVALVEILSQKQIKGAEAGTKLRNVLSKMSAVKGLPKEAQEQLLRMGVNMDLVSDNTVDFQKRLEEMAKVVKDPVALMKIFGAENKEAAAIILQNTKQFKDWTKEVTGTDSAYKQAAINSASLSTKIQEISNAFKNAVTSTSANNKSMDGLKKILGFVANNMEKIIKVATILISMFLVYKTAVTIVTAVQWVMAAAVNATLWPILAVMAAIAAIVLIIMNWGKITKWFSDTWAKFTGFITETWGKIVSYFQNTSLKDMFIDLGQTIFRFMLTPIILVLKLLSKLPGAVGNTAKTALTAIDKFTGKDGELNVNAQPLNAEATVERVRTERSEKTSNEKISMEVRAVNSTAKITENTGKYPVKTTSTMGR